MVRKKFLCRRCGRAFVKEVFEEGEAEEKRLRASPVKCPHCGSYEIEVA